MELALLGCVAWVVLAFRAGRIPAYGAWQETGDRFRLTFSRRRAAALIVSLLLMAWATWASQDIPAQASTLWIALAWAVGAALALGALAGSAEWRAFGAGLRASWRQDRLAWVVVGSATVLALIVRVVDLGDFPFLLSVDEAEFSNMARRVMLGWEISPFSTGWYQHPYAISTLQAVSLSLLGRSLFALRLPSAILGALHVPALYLLARELFGPRVARWSILALALLPVHVLFSRLALNQVGDTLAALLGCWFCLRAWRRGRAVDYVLLGAALGVGQFFYAAGLMSVLIVVAIVVYTAWRRPGLIRRQADGYVLAMAAFLIVTLPYHGYLLLNNLPLLPRSDFYLSSNQMMGIGPYVDSLRVSPDIFWGYLGSRLRDAYLAYLTVFDLGRYRGAPLALAGALTLAPFVLGVLIAARRWRDPRYLLPLLFLLVPPLPTLITQPVPDYFRYVLTMPFVALMVGLGLSAAQDALVPAAKWRRRALAVILAAMLAVEPLLYFSLWTGGRGSEALLANKLFNALGREIAALPVGVSIYFAFPPGASPRQSPVVGLLIDPEHGYHFRDLEDGMRHLPVIPCDEQAVFFIGPGYLDGIPLLQELYPRGILHWREVEGAARYARYDVFRCAE